MPNDDEDGIHKIGWRSYGDLTSVESGRAPEPEIAFFQMTPALI